MWTLHSCITGISVIENGVLLSNNINHQVTFVIGRTLNTNDPPQACIILVASLNIFMFDVIFHFCRFRNFCVYYLPTSRMLHDIAEVRSAHINFLACKLVLGIHVKWFVHTLKPFASTSQFGFILQNGLFEQHKSFQIASTLMSTSSTSPFLYTLTYPKIPNFFRSHVRKRNSIFVLINSSSVTIW